MGIPTLFCHGTSGRSYFVNTGPQSRMPIASNTTSICLGTPFPAPKSPDPNPLYAFKQLPPSATPFDPSIANHRLATSPPHRHITTYIDHCPLDALLITEFCAHGSLTRSHLRSKPTNFKNDLLRLLDNTLRALVHLHNNARLVHMDIHPSNILVTGSSPNFIFKLSNFSHSIALGPGLSSRFRLKKNMDTSYLAPELHPSAMHHADPEQLTKADVYSLGWTVLRLVLPTAVPPTNSAQLEGLLIEAGEKFNLSQEDMVHDRLLKLLWCMLQAEPTGRLSAADALVQLWGRPAGSCVPQETLVDEAVDYMNVDPVFSDANVPRDPKVLFPWVWWVVAEVQPQVEGGVVEDGAEDELNLERKEENKENKVRFDLPPSHGNSSGGSGDNRGERTRPGPKRKGFCHNGKYYPDWEESYPPPENYEGRVFKDKFAAPGDQGRGKTNHRTNDKQPKQKGMARDGWWYPDWVGPKPVPDWFINKKDTKRFPDKKRQERGKSRR